MKYILITLLILFILFNYKKKEGFNDIIPMNKRNPCPNNTFQSNNRCYKKCYDIGDSIGDVPCPYDQINIGQLCYKKCDEGYTHHNKKNKCCSICPNIGYRDRTEYCDIIN